MKESYYIYIYIYRWNYVEPIAVEHSENWYLGLFQVRNKRLFEIVAKKM